MRPKNLFDLDGRHLVATGLDDVHAVPAEYAMGSILEDRHIAGAKPAVAERRSRGFRLAPVLLEDRGPSRLDLAGVARCHGLPRFVNQPHDDSRERIPDRPGTPL